MTRQASIDLAAGEHELLFERLPATLQDNSLQVSAKSTGQAALLDVKTGTAFQAESGNERVQAVEARIRQLEARLGGLDDEAAVLENQREWVGLMQRGAAEPAREGSRLTLEQLNAIQAASAETLARALGACGASRPSASKDSANWRPCRPVCSNCAAI